jgi:YgiT-type zinc finger domain-containing protein
MKCTICRQGETRFGFVTVPLTRGEATVIIKNVPADVCDNCGEYYLTESVSAKMLTQAEAAAAGHVEGGIIRYAA